MFFVSDFSCLSIINVDGLSFLQVEGPVLLSLFLRNLGEAEDNVTALRAGDMEHR